MANFDDETLRAVGELIALGEQEGFGITFEPDSEGWRSASCAAWEAVTSTATTS